MQRPSGVRAHEPILVWCVWGQVPVLPCSPAGPSCWGVVRVPSSPSIFPGNVSSAESRHSFQGVLDPGRDLALLRSHAVLWDE